VFNILLRLYSLPKKWLRWFSRPGRETYFALISDDKGGVPGLGQLASETGTSHVISGPM